MPSSKCQRARPISATRAFFAGGRIVSSKAVETIVEPGKGIVAVRRRSTPRPRAWAIKASKERCEEWLVSLPVLTPILDDPPPECSVSRDLESNKAVGGSEMSTETEAAKECRKDMVEHRETRLSPLAKVLLSAAQTGSEANLTEHKGTSIKTRMSLDPGIAHLAAQSKGSHVRVATGTNAVPGTGDIGKHPSFTSTPAIGQAFSVGLRNIPDRKTEVANAPVIQRATLCEHSADPINESGALPGLQTAANTDASRLQPARSNVIKEPLLAPVPKAVGHITLPDTLPKTPLKTNTPAGKITKLQSTEMETERDQVSTQAISNIIRGSRAHGPVALDMDESVKKDRGSSKVQPLQLRDSNEGKESLEECKTQSQSLASPISIRLEFIVGGIPSAMSMPLFTSPGQ